MEQNREPRNKPTHQWPINLQQRRQKYIIEKKKQVLGKLDNHMSKYEIRTFPCTT